MIKMKCREDACAPSTALSEVKLQKFSKLLQQSNPNSACSSPLLMPKRNHSVPELVLYQAAMTDGDVAAAEHEEKERQVSLRKLVPQRLNPRSRSPLHVPSSDNYVQWQSNGRRTVGFRCSDESVPVYLSSSSEQSLSRTSAVSLSASSRSETTSSSASSSSITSPSFQHDSHLCVTIERPKYSSGSHHCSLSTSLPRVDFDQSVPDDPQSPTDASETSETLLHIDSLTSTSHLCIHSVPSSPTSPARASLSTSPAFLSTCNVSTFPRPGKNFVKDSIKKLRQSSPRFFRRIPRTIAQKESLIPRTSDVSDVPAITRKGLPRDRSFSDEIDSNEMKEQIFVRSNSMGNLHHGHHVESDAIYNGILQGRTDNLPPVASNVVRVFISSTFSDMSVERNTLMEHIYPELKEFCRQQGLEFQVLDMRWGVKEKAQDDHQISSLCIKEIQKCQRLSMGPSFVVLFGQKYGYRPFPSLIPTPEFLILRSALIVAGKDISLLDEWFCQDRNSVEPVYTLEPISSKLSNYCNKEDLKLREKDRSKWEEIFSSLQSLLREGAEICMKKNLMTKERHEKYFISVTEDEIREGLMRDKNKNRQLVLFRRIVDLKMNLKHRKAARFVDMNSDGHSTNEEAAKMLGKLREATMAELNVSKGSRSRNCHSFEISWNERDGINEVAHKDYLEDMCNVFSNTMKQQIRDSLSRQKGGISDDALALEIVQHMTLCHEKGQMFMGRDRVIERVRDYVLNSRADCPFVIHGESGSGKTSIMARIAYLIPRWFQPPINPIVVLRFIGITPKSANIVRLLQSMVQQVRAVFSLQLVELSDDIQKLTENFWDALKLAQKNKPLVILLDSLDQLLLNNQAQRLNWLPSVLPSGVHMILSTLPDESYGGPSDVGIYSRLQQKFGRGFNLAAVSHLGKKLSIDILNLWLEGEGRQLTDAQRLSIVTALEQCSLPLYTRLVFDEIRHWKSSQSPAKLPPTVRAIITVFFERLEEEHGKILLSHALGYLTASRSGLTEVELDDLLSLDDEVLDEVFTFWLPPVRRIPPLLWTRIHDDLNAYLIEREVDGVRILGWYHRQFKQVAQERFLGNECQCQKIHNMMADYFLGTWANGRAKPFEYRKSLAERISVKKLSGEADRRVLPQPLAWRNRVNGEEKEVYNVRKLAELPYHLFHADRLQELYSEVFYNYKWLHTKLKVTSVMDVLNDFALIANTKSKSHLDSLPVGRLSDCPVHVNFLASAIRLSSSALKRLPNTLAVELIGRLESCRKQFGHINTLLAKCRHDGVQHCPLLPIFQCFEPPNEAMLFSLESHNLQIIDVLFAPDGDMLYSLSSEGIVGWDLRHGDIVFQTDLSSMRPGKLATLFYHRSGRIILEGYTEGAPVCCLDALSGEVIQEIGARPNVFIHDTVLAGNFLIQEGRMFNIKEGTEAHSIKLLMNEGTKRRKRLMPVCFTSDATLCLVGLDKNTILLDTKTSKRLGVISGHDQASKMIFSWNNSRAIIGYENTCLVKVVETDISNPASLCSTYLKFDYRSTFPNVPNAYWLDGDTLSKGVCELLFSPNGNMFTINIKHVHLFLVHLRGKSFMLSSDAVGVSLVHIRDVSFTPDGQRVVAIVTNKMCVWSVTCGSLQARVELLGEEGPGFKLRMAAGNALVATSSPHETAIRVWDLAKLSSCLGANVHIYNNSVDVIVVDVVKNIAFVKIYRPLRAHKGYDYIDHFGIDLWNINDNSHHTYLPFAKSGKLIQMNVSASGRYMLLTTDVGIAHLTFLIDLTKPDFDLRLQQHGCRKALLSYCDRYVLTERSNFDSNSINLWDVHTGKLIYRCENSVCGVFTTDSRALVSITGGNLISVLNLSSLQSYTFKITEDGPITQLQEIPCRPNAIAVTILSGRVIVCDVNEKTIYWSCENVSPSGLLDFSKNGRYAVDGYLQVYDLNSGEIAATPDCPESSLRVEKHHVRITYDGRYVIWADTFPVDCVRVFSVETGKVIAEAGTHGVVTCLALSDLGYTVLVGCQNGRVLSLRLFRPDFQPANLARKGRLVRWPPVSARDIECLDPVYKLSTDRPEHSEESNKLLAMLTKVITDLTSGKSDVATNAEEDLHDSKACIIM